MQTLTQVLTQLQTDIRTATAQMLQDTADEFKQKGDEAVSDWQNKPSFSTTFTADSADMFDVLIVPSGGMKDVWKFIDLGTGLYGPKHSKYLILPKTPGGLLKFRTGYSPRTAPIALSQVGSGEASGSWVSTPQVIHPGIKARKFFETWLDELSPSLELRELQYLSKFI